MSNVLTSHIGTFDLWDLNVISSFVGRDFMPYPFMFTRPSRFATGEEAKAYALTVPDRFQHGTGEDGYCGPEPRRRFVWHGAPG